MSSVQYGKQIISTGTTNFSNSGKVEMYGDSRAKIIAMITRIKCKQRCLFRALILATQKDSFWNDNTAV